jgi:sterol desaturase/sphingolipid hydroxylase (fatty acid hydroxylase superfamily)
MKTGNPLSGLGGKCMLTTQFAIKDFITKTLLPLSSSSWSIELTGELAAFILLLCFAGLANLEQRFPKIRRPLGFTRQSYRTNAILFAVNSVLMSIFSVSTLFVIAEQYSGFGLLNYIDNPFTKGLIAFLAFDLLLYVWHRFCHRIDSFWLFHRVHHNDPYLNVSTAFRLHVIEILLTNVLKAMLIVVMGIDKIMVLAIETITTLGIMFHHTNISFTFERRLGCFMIVPYLHRMHHSVERQEHDSNYGAVLSIWDRLFGTLAEGIPVAIGIKMPSPFDVVNLIKFGFGQYHPKTQPVNMDYMIAEAAYFKAEKRNFYPGYEMRDWLEARKEILSQMNGKQGFISQLFGDDLAVKINNFAQQCQRIVKLEKLKVLPVHSQ